MTSRDHRASHPQMASHTTMVVIVSAVKAAL